MGNVSYRSLIEQNGAQLTRQFEALSERLEQFHHEGPQTESIALESAPASVDGELPGAQCGRRIDTGAEVTCPAEFIRELRNGENKYSVRGYLDQSQTTFGEFYLGMDDGPEYRRQSDGANSAIMSVSVEEAYDMAYALMIQVLDEDPSLIKDSFDLGKDRPPENPMRPTSRVIARMCKHYFGLPDGKHILEGGLPAGQEPVGMYCPEVYQRLSRHVFDQTQTPSDLEDAKTKAEQVGLPTVAQTEQYILQMRAEKKAFAQFAAPLDRVFGEGEEKGFASALVGLMLGLCPTVQVSHLFALKFWGFTDPAIFGKFAANVKASDKSLASIEGILLGDLIKAMLFAPVPDSIWRTTNSAFKIEGTSLDMEADEKLIFEIAKTAKTGLLSGQITDMEAFHKDMIFGGDRKSKDGYPQHACPGYDMGMGIILGMLAAQFTGLPSPS